MPQDDIISRLYYYRLGQGYLSNGIVRLLEKHIIDRLPVCDK
jgi:hypothetical protein